MSCRKGCAVSVLNRHRSRQYTAIDIVKASSGEDKCDAIAIVGRGFDEKLQVDLLLLDAACGDEI